MSIIFCWFFIYQVNPIGYIKYNDFSNLEGTAINKNRLISTSKTTTKRKKCHTRHKSGFFVRSLRFFLSRNRKVRFSKQMLLNFPPKFRRAWILIVGQTGGKQFPTRRNGHLAGIRIGVSFWSGRQSLTFKTGRGGKRRRPNLVWTWILGIKDVGGNAEQMDECDEGLAVSLVCFGRECWTPIVLHGECGKIWLYNYVFCVTSQCDYGLYLIICDWLTFLETIYPLNLDLNK